MKTIIAAFGAIFIVTLLVVGCSDETEEHSTEILSVTPENGAADVSVNTVVKVTFNETMDIASCQSRFGVFMGELDNIPADMTGRMDGEFTWNDDQSVMTFHPDSVLMDSTMYSICLQEGMMADDGHGGGMMMSGMNGHGMEVSGGIITRFMTEKTILARTISINPGNGASNIEKTTPIEVTFNTPMDTESCETRFGLHIGELTEMPMMGMMNGLSGSFHWNNENTLMTFEPDSPLMDSTMYTICLMEGMKTENHHDTMMMTGMTGYDNQVENGILSKFKTK